MITAAPATARGAPIKSSVRSYARATPAPVLSPEFKLQRKCACGGGCSFCQDEKKEAASGTLGLQKKIAIGAIDDPLEHEADVVADRLMRNESAKFRFSRVPPLQRHAATGITPPSDVVDAVLREPGQPLNPETRSYFETRMGFDLSAVRIHADGRSAEAAESVNALAFAVGNDVVFGRGRFNKGTEEGSRLLAHELAHVVQQTRTDRLDSPEVARRAATISAASFSPAAPTTSIAVTSFIPGKWFIDMTTDKPGLTLDSAVNVNCGAGSLAGYEVGIVQVETSELSEAKYFGLTATDGCLVARKSQLRKPSGACIDSRPGAFWTADGSGEKSLKPPACGTKVPLPSFSDRPAESYPGWIENSLTHKPNYIRDIKMNMSFIDALAVKTPTNHVNVLKWLGWGLDWAGQFKSTASGSTATGITEGGSFFTFGEDSVRPPEIPAKHGAPTTTCLEIAADTTGKDYVVETKASY